MQNIISRRR